MKKTFKISADVENLPQVIAFIDSNLEAVGCGMKAQTQIEISVEELFVNIAHYAYSSAVKASCNGTSDVAQAANADNSVSEEGNATVTFDFSEETRTVTISLIDSGVPYNPLSKPDPDITLSVEERQIGGLGIFMVKKNMDEVMYDFAAGKNIVTIKKII